MVCFVARFNDSELLKGKCTHLLHMKSSLLVISINVLQYSAVI